MEEIEKCHRIQPESPEKDLPQLLNKIREHVDHLRFKKVCSRYKPEHKLSE